MNTPYIFVNIVACLCFVLMFIAFFAAERSREMNAWILLLFDMVLWSAGSLFMRFELYPSYQFWFYVSLLALFMVPFLIYNYVYQVANENRPTIRWVWFLGTLVILAISATGFFLAPPQKMVDGFGNTLFVYKSDYKIAIPTVFLFIIIFSIIKLFNKILKEKGKRAPGVNELIIGCVLLGLGNIVQILPGNTFPWDTLSGIVFVILITVSLYKRYMFNTSMLVSGNLLYSIANSICVLSAALSFHKVRDFCEKNGHHITTPEVAAFIILSIALFIAIYAFRKLLNSIFTDDDRQGTKLRKYSDIVSKTLSVDEILDETVKVIQSEINVKQLYICLLEEGKYIPMRSAMPLNPGNFTISEDNPCVNYLKQGENHLVLKDFASTPLYKSIKNDERKLFAENGIVSICGIKDNDNVIGLILLTKKEKEKVNDKDTGYDYDDYSFLNTVCSVGSMALKNASLFEHVAEREHLFSGMTAFIPTVILIKKKGIPNFCFISANTEKVLGLPYSFFQQHSPQDALRECIGQEKADKILLDFAVSPELGYNFDMPFVRPDNKEEHTIRCSFTGILTDGAISHYVYVLSDISEDIQAKELLKSSVEIAQNSNKAKDEFLSHMSHEIRTPMNSIAGLTYLAREQVDEKQNSVLSDYLDQISQSAHYLLNMLNNIMDMSKIENKLYEIKNERFDVRKVIDEVTSIYSSQMLAKGIDFVCDIDSFEYEKLMGDEIALQKILNNLISNAYKFTPNGGTVRLYAAQRYMGNRNVVLHFEVSDTGIGISKEFSKKIFEPYTQEVISNGNKTGSGLGMAICKNMVDMMGGTITASSNLGKGTKFTVDIPFGMCTESQQTEVKKAIDYSILNGKHIMVVDDVVVNTMITSKLLEKHGVIVDTAENGEVALELFESHKDFYYDCILMDIQMPVMDGFEAAEAIRAKKRRYSTYIPILAMTADAFLNEAGDAARTNFDGYIIKPVSPDILYERLVQMFSERE